MKEITLISVVFLLDALSTVTLKINFQKQSNNVNETVETIKII